MRHLRPSTDCVVLTHGPAGAGMPPHHGRFRLLCRLLTWTYPVIQPWLWWACGRSLPVKSVVFISKVMYPCLLSQMGVTQMAWLALAWSRPVLADGKISSYYSLPLHSLSSLYLSLFSVFPSLFPLIFLLPSLPASFI